MPVERHPLWARLPPVSEPTPEQLARVQQAVEERIRARRLRRLRWVPGLLLGFGLLWWLLSLRMTAALPMRAPMPVPAAEHASSTTASDPVDRKREAAEPPAPVAATTPRLPVATVPATPERLATHAPAARVAEKPSQLAELPPAAPRQALRDDAEAALLGQAISRLRRERNPQGALEALAIYREEFPHGALRGEALLVQAEALARLGRNQELVSVLDPDALVGLPRSTELTLLRAEALAKLERCGDAIPIFGEILSPGEGDPSVEARLRERALYGRALCHLRNGHMAAARRDLEREEDEFPEQAEKVHQALRSIAGEP